MRLLRLVSGNPHAAYAEIAKAAGLSEAAVQRSFSDLKLLGAVERAGSRKTGHWRIAGAGPAGRRACAAGFWKQGRGLGKAGKGAGFVLPLKEP